MFKKFFLKKIFYGKESLKKKNIAHVILSYKQEVAGVLTVALLTFLMLSFFSYNPTDNCWFYFSSANKSIFNWCGVVGANTAGFFFFLLGNASYLLLFCLLILSIFLFQGISFKESWVRFVALPVFILAGSTLFSIHGVLFLARRSGGVIGAGLKSISLDVFDKVGSLILLYAVVWICLLLIAQVSVINFFLFLVTFSWKWLCAGILFVWRGLKNDLCSLGCLFKRKKLKEKALNKSNNKKTEVLKSGTEDELWSELSNLAQKANGKKGEVSHVDAAHLDVAHLDVERLDVAQAVNFDDHECVCDSGDGQYKKEKLDFAEFQEQRVSTLDKEQIELDCQEQGKRLEEKLLHFGIKGKVVAVRPGPIITLFEYKPEIDSKISKIVALEDDLALALTALSIRIVAPIPGRNVIGFEISNQTRSDVFLSDVLEHEESKKNNSCLPLAFGVDITGNPVIEDLVKMPHLLVAGSTGSGKSVGLNSMLVNLLCRLTSDELKLILIDPKRLEFVPYADIPHLLFPIVTNPRKAVPILKWVVQEMEDRYDLMARAGVRNILDYRRAFDLQKTKKVEESELLPVMPFIVLMIDELSDLMLVAGRDVETQITRIAQMARAAGIHMIVATQRPSVDVLTGVIKVNFPARIAFRVSSKIDSRTIIDGSGAEKLLGRGDMLFVNSGTSIAKRIHGAYVSSSEIERLTNHLRMQEKVSYLKLEDELRLSNMSGIEEFEDELYDEIRDFVSSIDEVSISLLQRRYRIGFNRSARLIEKLEMDGLVAPAQGGKIRKVLR